LAQALSFVPMSRSYNFGEYRINPALRELWRGNSLVALPPHVFDCLTYLIERHDRAVGRDELVAAVWGKTQISDTLLGQTVLRIRRELGDDAKEQRTLRTIPRFGYRWVAALDIHESDDGAAPHLQPTTGDTAGQIAAPPASAPPPVAAARPASRRDARIVAATLAAAVLIGAATWAWRVHDRASTRIPAFVGDKSLTSAVLPAGIEAGTESAWMRLGVMDVVAGRLRSSGLPSVPSEDVVALLNAPAANRSSSVRETLAAGLLVTPRVQQVDEHWQVDLDADNGVGQHYTVDARGRDVTAAARAATDKLLVALGRRPADTTAESSADAILVQRIDAAVLADDPDAARALIAQASTEIQRSPEVRLRLAKLEFRGGRLDAARARLTALLDEAPAKTAPVLRASVLNGLGSVALREDKPEQAEPAFDEAIALLQDHPDPAQLGIAFIGRAGAAAQRRKFEAAAADYARARIALRQANDVLALIRVAANEGFLDLDQGRPAQALPQFITAADGFKQWGALNEAIFTYIGQIGSYLALLDGRSAMQAADAAETLAQRIDNRSTLDSLHLARAKALAAVGRLHESRDWLDRLRSAGSNSITTAAAGGVLARLELDSNNAVVAGDLAEQTVLVLDAPGYSGQRADAWLTQVRAALRAANAGRAAALIAAFDRWAAQTDEPRARLYARLAAAEYSLQFGDGKQWRSAFDAAREMAARNAIPSEIATVANSYAEALFADRDLDAAVIEVGRVSRWSEQDFLCAVLEARLYAALGRNEARQTAVSRARTLAGERSIPADALTVPVSTRAAAQ
jgi:DNA-binding winged helix-turn-helix (wHTH) protein/tetratricopeptide (TPR) repeat protein